MQPVTSSDDPYPETLVAEMGVPRGVQKHHLPIAKPLRQLGIDVVGDQQPTKKATTAFLEQGGEPLPPRPELDLGRHVERPPPDTEA